MSRLRSILAALAALALLIGVGIAVNSVSTTALAAKTAPSEQVVNACVKKSTGEIRIRTKKKCQKGWRAMSWNAAGPAGQDGAAVVSDEMYINLQSGREDLHRVNMAFSMARNQRKAGRPGTIFLNINAPELATTGLPAALRWRDYPPIKDQMSELIGLGITVLVCPMCSADQGVTADQLVPGAQMSNPMLTKEHTKPGTVTMSY